MGFVFLKKCILMHKLNFREGLSEKSSSNLSDIMK